MGKLYPALSGQKVIIILSAFHTYKSNLFPLKTASSLLMNVTPLYTDCMNTSCDAWCYKMLVEQSSHIVENMQENSMVENTTYM